MKSITKRRTLTAEEVKARLLVRGQLAKMKQIERHIEQTRLLDPGWEDDLDRIAQS